MATKNQDNPMRNIKIEKLVLNISAGESGDKLMKAAQLDLDRVRKIFPDAKVKKAKTTNDGSA